MRATSSCSTPTRWCPRAGLAPDRALRPRPPDRLGDADVERCRDLLAPIICHSMPLPAGWSDRMVRRRAGFFRALIVCRPPRPAWGFCMAMNVAAGFGRQPRFGHGAFGRGLRRGGSTGCQKTRKARRRHVGAAISVRRTPRRPELRRRGRTRWARLAGPTSHGSRGRLSRPTNFEFQAYIGRDPLCTPRLALAVAIRGRVEPPMPYRASILAHSMGGGGADHALGLRDRRAAPRRGQYALVLRVGRAAALANSNCMPRAGVISVATSDLQHIRRILDPVPALCIVYSCGVGDRDPVTLPDALLSLLREGKPDRLEARLPRLFRDQPLLLPVERRWRLSRAGCGPATRTRPISRGARKADRPPCGNAGLRGGAFCRTAPRSRCLAIQPLAPAPGLSRTGRPRGLSAAWQ